MKYIAVLIILLFGMGVFLMLNDRILPQKGVQQTPATGTPTPTKFAVIPDGWTLFSDEKIGVSFAAPPDYEIDKSGENSVTAKPPVNKNYPAGNTRFFYVSTVLNADKDDETGKIYNYSASFHNKLMEMKVNEIKNTSGNSGQKDWYNYERYGDDAFNGRSAKVFVNQRPWEFPNGTWEYRYVFEFAEKTVIAGAYIEGRPSDAPFTLPVLTQIMNTLVIK